MSAVIAQRNEVELARTGVTVSVPNNDVARLMYYLNCVCVVIDCANDPDIQRFTSYNNWHHLSTEEQKLLVVLCYKFSPDVFDNKVFFQSDALCQDSPNEFYEIRQVRNQLLVADSIIIAGQQRHVNKIMAYKLAWMQSFYVEPMQRLVQRLSNSNTPAITYTSNATVSTGSSKKVNYIVGCCVCLFCILPVIAGIIYVLIWVFS